MAITVSRCITLRVQDVSLSILYLRVAMAIHTGSFRVDALIVYHCTDRCQYVLLQYYPLQANSRPLNSLEIKHSTNKSRP